MKNYEQLLINTIDVLNDVYNLDISVSVDGKGWHIKYNDKKFKTCKDARDCGLALDTILELYKAQRGA